VCFSDDPRADLKAYAGANLQQETVAESAVRNAPAFSRFLKVASHGNATIVNFTNVADDAQVARTTVGRSQSSRSISFWAIIQRSRSRPRRTFPLKI